MFAWRAKAKRGKYSLIPQGTRVCHLPMDGLFAETLLSTVILYIIQKHLEGSGQSWIIKGQTNLVNDETVCSFKYNCRIFTSSFSFI